MTPKTIAQQILQKKLDWVYQEIPNRIVPFFRNEKGQVRSNFINEELDPVKSQVAKELKKQGFSVTETPDALLVEFDL